jgi:hypothetical protein
MSLGYDRELKIFNLNDTASLVVTLYDEMDEPYTAEELISVKFVIQSPDGTKIEETGEIGTDGTGRLNYEGTEELGHYRVVATFNTSKSGRKSVHCDFETVDPWDESEPSQSWYAANDAWEKFEDCFDSEEGGPWLTDMTKNVFNKQKMERFIDDALLSINVQNPTTSATLDEFIQPPHTESGGEEKHFPAQATSSLPVLTQALVLQLIRHLMRSYVEQPTVAGSPISWQERRDYLQRWKEVYAIELEEYKRILALWKRQFLELGATRSLVSSKAGRLLAAPLRTRNVGRGYW